MTETELKLIRDIAANNAVRFPIRRAFIFKDENGEQTSCSYRKFYRKSAYLAQALCEKLSLENKTVAVMMKNSWQWCVSYFAVTGGVGTVVPLERETPHDELMRIVKLIGISAIITDDKKAQELSEACSGKLIKKVKLITTGQPSDGIYGFDALIEEGKQLYKKEGARRIFDKELNEDAPAVMLMTSGTTGNPKIVMLSNKNICSDIVGTLGLLNVSYDDVTLCALPLHHTYQCIVMLMTLYIGGSVCFSPSLRRVSNDLVFYSPTIFACVPLLLEKTYQKIMRTMAEQKKVKKPKISNDNMGELKRKGNDEIHAAFGGKLRIIITGAAAVNPTVAKAFSAFGFKIIIGYGLTECSPIVLLNNGDSMKFDSVGVPIENVEVKIVNPDEDGIGELCVKGPNVMLGYYKNKKATDEVIRDGWFYTGDLGEVDDDGDYKITGRIKNVIIAKNGKNVYPEEIESYLNSDPMVMESLIFAEEGEDEEVTANVVPDEEAIKTQLNKEKLTKEDVQNAISQVVKRINKILPSYKSIKKFKISSEEIPKTSTNKVKRIFKKKKETEQPQPEEENTELQNEENNEN